MSAAEWSAMFGVVVGWVARLVFVGWCADVDARRRRKLPRYGPRGT